MENWEETLYAMFREVRDSAYKIIEGKGATYYAIAQAVMRITRSIMRNEHSVLPVSTLVEGHYCTTDICLGVPSVVGENGVERVLDLPLNEEESRAFCESAAKLRATLEETYAQFV